MFYFKFNYLLMVLVAQNKESKYVVDISFPLKLFDYILPRDWLSLDYPKKIL